VTCVRAGVSKGALCLAVAGPNREERLHQVRQRVGVREGDAPLFVRHGLFRFSRNPIFAGMIFIGLSIAVSANIWWAWVALLTFALACHAQVRIEERHLSKSFGAAYEQFCDEVPRWIGISK